MCIKNVSFGGNGIERMKCEKKLSVGLRSSITARRSSRRAVISQFQCFIEEKFGVSLTNKRYCVKKLFKRPTRHANQRVYCSMQLVYTSQMPVSYLFFLFRHWILEATSKKNPRFKFIADTPRQRSFSSPQRAISAQISSLLQR